jgi:hypothetical protein
MHTYLLAFLPEVMDAVVVRDLLPLFDLSLSDHEDPVSVRVDPEGVGLAGVVQEQQRGEHRTPRLQCRINGTVSRITKNERTLVYSST